MAVAPLSREQLVADAMFIYVGEVGALRENGGQAEADIALQSVEKAMLGTGEENPTVYYRLPDRTGDDSTQGQHSPLKQGDRVRVFVRYDAAGRAQLLEPNGWEPA